MPQPEPERAIWRSLQTRGVPVCGAWRRYEAFRDDVGCRPHPTHVLSRLDKSKPYGPGNVEWAPKWRDNLRRSRPSQAIYRGVSFHPPSGRWFARISAAGRRRHLGYFDTAIDAAEAYNTAAKELHGEHAEINVLPQRPPSVLR